MGGKTGNVLSMKQISYRSLVHLYLFPISYILISRSIYTTLLHPKRYVYLTGIYIIQKNFRCSSTQANRYLGPGKI
jgi:hypothetical protein